MLENPDISVIITTYNRANFIDRAIKSVLNQIYQDFEIIIVDDGSTDNTEEIIKGYKDKRIIYIKHKKNQGISAARNTRIKKSRGEYIAFLDSDDEWVPEKLSKQVKILQNESTEVGVVYSNLCYIDENGKDMNKLLNPKREGYIYKDLLGENCVGPPSTLLIRKECFNQVGLFDSQQDAHEDWDMWIRIAKSYKFALIKIPLVKYRLHSNQISKNLEVKIIMAKRILVKYTDELKKRYSLHSKHYFSIGNKFCHIGKTKEGQRYLLKAISLYPFCIRYYICLLGSLFGPKFFLCFVDIKKYLTDILKNLLLKLKTQ